MTDKAMTDQFEPGYNSVNWRVAFDPSSFFFLKYICLKFINEWEMGIYVIKHILKT